MTGLAPDLHADVVLDGSNVLVVGAAMTGTRELLYEVLAAAGARRGRRRWTTF